MFDTTKDLKAINDIVNADLIKLTDLEYANKLRLDLDKYHYVSFMKFSPQLIHSHRLLLWSRTSWRCVVCMDIALFLSYRNWASLNCLTHFLFLRDTEKVMIMRPDRYSIVVWICRTYHDDVIKWKHFPRHWPLCGEFSLICVWINGWVNNREAGDLRRHRGHYDVNVMIKMYVEYQGPVIGNELS